MIHFIDMGQGSSFFKFIDVYWKAGHTGNNRTIHRLCNLMRKMNVKLAVVEEYLNLKKA